MTKPIIEVRGLSKKYKIGSKRAGDLKDSFRNLFSFSSSSVKEFWALKDISFAVEEGEVFGIIGPNGSGKSTLLKILSKITPPTSGKAVLRGRVSSLLEVGTGFHPELTGRENIFLNGSILGMKRAEIKAKFDEIVDFSGVEQFIDTPVKHFSSGMYVRLAFSVAAHLDPEILLVDEVLSVGDMAFREKSLGKMSEVAKSGRTVLFVSHNLGAVKNLCKRGILLDAGHVVIENNIREVISNYYHDKAKPSEKLNLKLGLSVLQFGLADSHDDDTSTLQAGEPCNIRLVFQLEKNMTGLNIRIECKDRSGLTLFVCNNDLTGDQLEGKSGRNELICHIPKLPLNTGNYKLILYIRHKNQELIRSHSTKLEVFPGKFYSTGRMPTREKLFLIGHRWITKLKQGQNDKQ